MRRAAHSPMEGSLPPLLGPALLPAARDAPSWSSLRAKILSFTRGRSKSPAAAPDTGGSRSPSMPRLPSLRSPTPRSPTARSPRSPTSRSPLGPSPCRSPTNKSPPSKSPTSRFAPPGVLSRGALPRPAPREVSSPASEQPEGLAGRRALMRRCLKKAFSLNLEGGLTSGGGGEVGGGGGGGGGGAGGRKVQLKVRGSPGEQVVELTQLDEDDDETAAAMAAAVGARRARKYSYQGNDSTPGSPVEATTPKRHSFSSGGGEGEGRAGIIVTSSELAGLLGPRRHLSPPGTAPPKDKSPTPPSSAVPRRGRSQSIAACWDQQGQGGAGAGGGGPQAPITIRRTDCDYEAAAPRSAPLEAPREEEGEEEAWDGAAGLALDPGLLGSAIEHFLKAAHGEDPEALAPTAAAAVAAPAGLQVK
ncbi:translation initiation factor IF-2-like [Eriocheir sinensis]|uniref:translation initiation factor IF-2-like n=1 Tax=Eriocheir sinensis TaxID=95602 RepID=UPI0021C80C60|nr:translation initiation factor IF-2-like [Eriocheir sinensis]XP_050700046.1 translation initiation factor IF-2-like [Eriocheir sinensis]XP_050700047.1 translation initiation factor IF-2-like [Eriocheir sinensis]XP_050700048.1 translation initiation factor IF-2-like [Eriocheir sinensis]XP_050700049.1 translation initiation factor IF-2-like [Eriocheir sinensis]